MSNTIELTKAFNIVIGLHDEIKKSIKAAESSLIKHSFDLDINYDLIKKIIKDLIDSKRIQLLNESKLIYDSYKPNT